MAIQALKDTEVMKRQVRVALKNSGLINPERIEEYIAKDGYVALHTVLTTMKPADVIQVVSDSTLAGRGGGGFSTGRKWSFAAANKADQKYIVCNADEGDPGAFMDRAILEGDPHVVLEAMAIAGYAIGATEGYIYIRAEYPTAIKRLEIALSQAKELGVLGNNIFGTKHSFNIRIKKGSGAFVCGEETALLASIEGKRGEPMPRPPFPAEKGLFGKPTIINNVETFACVPHIINNGAKWFASIGKAKDGKLGTKVFCLGGAIANAGLVEVPMGTSIRDIIEVFGGGIPGGKNFKAAQTGGPSGGCIPPKYLDLGVGFQELLDIGSMMGSGGLVVLDDSNCMVDVARFFLDFTVDESCGKCTPCRVGTKRLLEILTRMTEGLATETDLENLKYLCRYIIDTSLCGLGNSAPNPVVSTMTYFMEEYESHVRDKKCPAGACKSMSKLIINDKCIACHLCVPVCPVDAIEGTQREKGSYKINEKCIKCDACIPKCPVKAIVYE